MTEERVKQILEGLKNRGAIVGEGKIFFPEDPPTDEEQTLVKELRKLLEKGE